MFSWLDLNDLNADNAFTFMMKPKNSLSEKKNLYAQACKILSLHIFLAFLFYPLS